MIELYDSLADLMSNMLPMLWLPVIMVTLRCTFNIVKEIARGTTIATGERKEKIKEYNERIVKLEKAETKINIDKDLQKYFNYKE